MGKSKETAAVTAISLKTLTKRGRTYYDSLTFNEQRFFVGNTVAVQHKESVASSWHPWKKKWAVAQILSLYEHNKKYKAELRWMYRCGELPDEAQQICRSRRTKKELEFTIFECEWLPGEEFPIDSILGNVMLMSEKSKFSNKIKSSSTPTFFCDTYLKKTEASNRVYSEQKLNDWVQTKEGYPSESVLRGLQCLSNLNKELVQFYLKCFSCRGPDSETKPRETRKEQTKSFKNKKRKDVEKEVSTTDSVNPTKRARSTRSRKQKDTSCVSLSSASVSSRRRKTRSSVSTKNCSESSDGSTVCQVDVIPDTRHAPLPISEIVESEDRISTETAPFHVNRSMLRTYFREILIEPPISNYVIHHCTPDSEWKVSLGDIVVIHCEHGAGRTVFDFKGPIAGMHYPFTVGWAIAEVIAIWKVHKDNRDFALQLETLNCSGNHNLGDVQLEIRWFWRRCELPGNKGAAREGPTTYEEIFETDHVDECSASSLLGPVKVIPGLEDVSVKEALFHCGIPMITCTNTKLWSFHRRSIIPSASNNGRGARSRMYSSSCIKDDMLRKAIESDMDNTDEGQIKPSIPSVQEDQPPWRESFQRVIRKLTLTQASSDAYDDYVALVGRGKEQGEISSFLRAAIKGANNSCSDGSTSSSLFVAGPPGTGKTVSVCSVINKLQQEQVEGLLPDFDFFSLNGMEMRHPFESYVKFWELISGHAKDRLAPEVAATKLDRYFSGTFFKDVPRRSTIVLMLDEIDYLVTKKESVLYNFFDWPKQSFEVQHGPRLIVIGISNTVNLPSQLKASVRSRLGSARCDFKSYNVNDIIKILTNKIESDSPNYKVFDKHAIVFASRKVAAVTGDIRKALQTCRAAAEAVFQQVEKGTRKDKPGNPIVTIKDVQMVCREKIGSVMSNAIAFSTPFQALILVSLGALARHSGREMGFFDIGELMTKIEAVANSSGNLEYTPAPSFHELLEILIRLAEARLVRLHTEKSTSSSFRCSQGGNGGVWPLVTLNVDECDIVSALKNTPHSQLVEKQLSGSLF